MSTAPTQALDLTMTVADIVAAVDANGDGQLSDAEKAQARALGSKLHEARTQANAQAFTAANQFASSEWKALIKAVGPGIVTGVGGEGATKI